MTIIENLGPDPIFITLKDGTILRSVLEGESSIIEERHFVISKGVATIKYKTSANSTTLAVDKESR